MYRRSSLSNGTVLFVVALFVLTAAQIAGSDRRAWASSQSPTAQAASVKPYAYANISSNTSYDVMLADGLSTKDRRIARVKVDSVFFGNVSAKLSTDYSTTAFRVSGDRLGGSSIYSVDIRTGKYLQIAASRTGAESIGSYAWSPAGNTLAFVRSSPAPDPADVDDTYGDIYIYSVGFKAAKLAGSHGNDHVLGFSQDGLGVYADRREGQLEHLVYIPMSGGEARVLLKSQPALKLSQFTVWSPLGAPSKVAYLAEGAFTLQQSSNAPLTGRFSRPNSLGIIVSDMLGTGATVLRRDAEDFSFMEWTSNGQGLVVGGTRSGAAWAIDMAGNRRAVNTSLANMHTATGSADGTLVVVSDMPTTRLVTVNVATGSLVSNRYLGVTPKAGAVVVKMRVPYIHQVKDLAQNGDGNWACGPTTLAMALAYYGKLEPWTEQSVTDLVTTSGSSGLNAPSAPKPVTGADFAPYVTNKYTAYGHSYNAVARDPRGNMLAGLYGTICPTGLASWQQMTSVLNWHGLSSQYVSLTWDGIVAALKRGHPVVLGNDLTSQGHILLVIGYTADGNLIVDDPYGNRFSPGYGGNDGNGVIYPWKLVTPRHALEVIGTVPTQK